jgi:hypothetical protein
MKPLVAADKIIWLESNKRIAAEATKWHFSWGERITRS